MKIIQTFKSMPKNVWVLALTLSLALAPVPMLVLISGVIGAQMAPSSSLATLPLAMNVIGLAVFAIPAAMIANKTGRKLAGYVGLSISCLGLLTCGLSTKLNSFPLLIVGCIFIGMSVAFLQQFRFAAIESLKNPEDAGPAISILMLCSIVSGLLGPELGSSAKNILSSAYTGSFLAMAAVIGFAMLVFGFFRNPEIRENHHEGPVRPLKTIVSQPVFLVALCASLIGYALMSFLMTSTPISMNVVQGHSMTDSKWVIQSHLVAMFLPSLFSGLLLKRFGAGILMTAGSGLYVLVILVASMGQHVIHYWWALVLLGIGWNFLFISGTALLPLSYKLSERFKIQALNDFSVFGAQAIASLSAGWVLFKFGWLTQLMICIPFAILVLLMSLWYLFRGKAW